MALLTGQSIENESKAGSEGQPLETLRTPPNEKFICTNGRTVLFCTAPLLCTLFDFFKERRILFYAHINRNNIFLIFSLDIEQAGPELSCVATFQRVD